MLFDTPSKLWDGPHCIMIPNVQMRKLRLGEVTRQGGGRTEVEPKPRDPRICVLSHYSILSMCLPQRSGGTSMQPLFLSPACLVSCTSSEALRVL